MLVGLVEILIDKNRKYDTNYRGSMPGTRLDNLLGTTEPVMLWEPILIYGG
jgi:hypothetical protein